MRLEELRFNIEELQILGGRIKAARKNAHYTQNAVADIIECSIGHLSAIENGKTMPSGDELVCFCKMYKRDLNYFFWDLLDFDDQKPGNQEAEFMVKYGYMTDETLKWNIRVMQDVMRVMKEEEERRQNEEK